MLNSYDNIANRKSECCNNDAFRRNEGANYCCKDNASTFKSKCCTDGKGYSYCCTGMRLKCSGGYRSTKHNGTYDSYTTCTLTGCLDGYYAAVSGVQADAAYNPTFTYDGQTVSWTNVKGTSYDNGNPNACRSCQIVRSSDGHAVVFESPCSGGNVTYNGNGVWSGGDHGNTDCDISYSAGDTCPSWNYPIGDRKYCQP
jgi:hypothetical protein